MEMPTWVREEGITVRNHRFSKSEMWEGPCDTHTQNFKLRGHVLQKRKNRFTFRSVSLFGYGTEGITAYTHVGQRKQKTTLAGPGVPHVGQEPPTPDILHELRTVSFNINNHSYHGGQPLRMRTRHRSLGRVYDLATARNQIHFHNRVHVLKLAPNKA